MNICFSVNGQEIKAQVDPETSLLTFLREELGLTGTKDGCSEGTCGACTVIVDGEAKRACVLKIKRVVGRSVETIESLADGDRLHSLQYTMVREGAIQCGFCTPGMVMAGKTLLDENPDPTEVEIKNAQAQPVSLHRLPANHRRHPGSGPNAPQ